MHKSECLRFKKVKILLKSGILWKPASNGTRFDVERVKMNYAHYDLATLRALYDKEKAELTQALLNGASWESVREQRFRVTELSIAVHRRISGESNPAENQTRKDS